MRDFHLIGRRVTVEDWCHGHKPDGNELQVSFERGDNGTLARAANDPNTDLRVFGEYDPDSEYFGYEQNGGRLELPVSSLLDGYRLRGTVGRIGGA
jgi:hypothetical protein